MGRVKIKVVSIGHLPAIFDRRKVEKWTSSFLAPTGEIEQFTLDCNSDGDAWEFTDAALERKLPTTFDGDLLVAIVGVPIEHNWYTRIVGSNKVVITFHEIGEILDSHHIPIENALYRLLYAYALAYKALGDCRPTRDTIPDFSHDETRGCLFDMNGIKSDIVYSCVQPIICSECAAKLRRHRVSENDITTVQRELRAIRKPLYYWLADHVKKHPIWSFAISCLLAVVLGASGSLLATIIYESLCRTP